MIAQAQDAIGSKSPVRQIIVALMVCVPLVGYPIWALLDREPPYIRVSGQVVAVAPEECGLAAGPLDDIEPGSCVAVQWVIKPLRPCDPSTRNNITRVIQDSERVNWPIGPVEGYIGSKQTASEPLTRFFRIPSGAAPGPAIYKSSATFACNPLQWVPWLQWLFWPITVSQPDLKFEIH